MPYIITADNKYLNHNSVNNTAQWTRKGEASTFEAILQAEYMRCIYGGVIKPIIKRKKDKYESRKFLD